MKNVKISHNPYIVTSEIIVDGVPTASNGRFGQYLNERFQLWVDKIPEMLVDEYNDDEFNINFHGTEIDYQDLVVAVESAHLKDSELNFTLTWEKAKDFNEKETDIRKLFEYTQKLPFPELQSAAMKDSFNKAFSETCEVNVVATMSAGKSTLINAMLCSKLMPSKSGACTATITRIKDTENEGFSASVHDSEGNEIVNYKRLDNKIMKELNADPQVSEIHVKGRIPFVDSGAVSLILVDTPGPDNARDKRHGEVTAHALDNDSKMLVLFVMNGGKLHDEAQELFLRKIAASMGVDGKQSKERFLFVINKMDAYDEEDDDIKGETIPDTIKYLNEMGIQNPNIFPVAAEPALNIRRYYQSSNEAEREKLYNKIKPTAEKLIAQEQLHLEGYSRLPRASREKIESRLQTAVENHDILGQALVHSGIMNIEETINAYVTKYCRPAKILTVVDNFKKSLKDAEAFAKTKKEIASQTKERDKYSADIARLEEKLKSEKEQKIFAEKLKKLEISSKLNTEVANLTAAFEKPLTSVFVNCPEELKEDEAMRYIKQFSKVAEDQGNQFQLAVEKLLDSDIRATSQKLLHEYIEHLRAISDEVLGKDGLKIDLGSFVMGTLASLDPDDALSQSVDSRTQTHQEQRSRTTTKKRMWFNPMRLFKGDYYDVTEYYTVDVTEKIKFISRDKLINCLIPPIRKSLSNEKMRINSFAEQESKRIKEYFLVQFARVTKILAEKAEELKKATQSKKNAEIALEAAEKLLSELESVKSELAAILEI